MTVAKIIGYVISVVIVIQRAPETTSKRKTYHLIKYHVKLNRTTVATKFQVFISRGLPIFNCRNWSVRVMSVLRFVICIIVTIVQRFSTTENWDEMKDETIEHGDWASEKFCEEMHTCKQQVSRMGFHLRCWWWFAAMCYRKRSTEVSNWIRTSLVWFCNRCWATIDHYPCSICLCSNSPVSQIQKT